MVTSPTYGHKYHGVTQNKLSSLTLQSAYVQVYMRVEFWIVRVSLLCSPWSDFQFFLVFSNCNR